MLNQGVDAQKDKDGKMTIRVKVERGAGFLARFQPPFMIRTIELDELGGFVFEQIDGDASVMNIIERFITRFRTDRREAELSTAEFLKSLMKRGVISIAVK